MSQADHYVREDVRAFLDFLVEFVRRTLAGVDMGAPPRA